MSKNGREVIAVVGGLIMSLIFKDYITDVWAWKWISNSFHQEAIDWTATGLFWLGTGFLFLEGFDTLKWIIHFKTESDDTSPRWEERRAIVYTALILLSFIPFYDIVKSTTHKEDSDTTVKIVVVSTDLAIFYFLWAICKVLEPWPRADRFRIRIIPGYTWHVNKTQLWGINLARLLISSGGFWLIPCFVKSDSCRLQGMFFWFVACFAAALGCQYDYYFGRETLARIAETKVAPIAHG